MEMRKTRTKPLTIEGRLPNAFKEDEAFYWSQRNELMKLYRGQWIGVHNGEVLAHGDDLYEVTSQAFQRSNACAYINKVGEEHRLKVKIRRVTFDYDTSYIPFALPRARVVFSNFPRTKRMIREDVIPDTGSDVSCLPVDNCEALDLFKTPGVKLLSQRYGQSERESVLIPAWAEINGLEYLSFIQPVEEHERLLGRDVMNQLTTTFRGKDGKTIFQRSRRH
jgi:hypothetical protein